MRSISVLVARRRGQQRTVLAATGLVAALALTTTACGGSGAQTANGASGAAASQSAGSADGKVQVPAGLANKLKEHGINVSQWENGSWKNWDKSKWLRDAKDFVNPVIKGLWKPERMQSAQEANKTVSTKDAYAGQGMSDPAPQPVQALAEKTPYHEYSAPVGKVFFDSPRGPMVCSGTIIKDVNHPPPHVQVTTNLLCTLIPLPHGLQQFGTCRHGAALPGTRRLGLATHS
ncbi:hypothetical protein [Streptomyces camelliae]|uniref:hypothetical protein n=1 Tax=Streptomyces camelliae TaxID=3004093 RepID=UPI003D16E0A3